MGQIRSAPAKIKLSDRQRHELEELAAGRGPFAQRAKAILTLNKSLPDRRTIAAALDCSHRRPSANWRRAYANGRHREAQEAQGALPNTAGTSRCDSRRPSGPRSNPGRRTPANPSAATFAPTSFSSTTMGVADPRHREAARHLAESASSTLRHRFLAYRLDGIAPAPPQPQRARRTRPRPSHNEQLRQDQRGGGPPQGP